MNEKELLQIIEQAAKEGWTELDLSEKGLTKLPLEIGQLTDLMDLNLEKNELTALPPEIGQLTNLRKLDLHDNQLTALPPEIGQLTNLTELALRRNQLTALPPEIGQLTNLMMLSFSGNELTALPPEIGQLTNLTTLIIGKNELTALPSEIGQLTNLTTLNLWNNPLTVVPPEVVRLPKLTWLRLGLTRLATLSPEIAQLTNLEYFDLCENQLAALPPQIGQLTSLTELDLHANQLTALPPQIGQLTNLTELDLSDNQLTTLPPEIGQLTNLTELDLSDNQLTALPPQIGQLTNLKMLDLTGNPLPIPPEILVKVKEPATIINYYLQHEAGLRRPLNEAKMLLVGQGSVGKTSLVRRLVEGSFNPRENKTEGIDIRQWQVAVDSQDIRLNVWDFGGQEIMHATHQFFLTRRSLYLLVLDARLDEDENRLEYWLKIIQSFGGESPIIIVGNKIDQHPLDIDRRGLQNKYPSIKAFVETSCETGEGIDKLKAVITREVGVLEHIHDQLLLNWFAVKTRLEGMEEDYIPYPEYVRMCEAENIADAVSQRTLVGFLHDLGIVLNFQEDPRLEDTNILNPEWVTNGVYRILNSNELFQSKGVLERGQLNQILDYQEYPRDKHLFIMDMMRKFELCFDFEGFADRRFLIPDLLAKEEPYTGDWGDALAFQYHYNVLPGSIISRFIVRMHPYVHKSTYWRSGVVLAYNGSKALVKADREDKKIFIWVSGPERARRTFLAITRAEFDAIHRTISRIEAAEKVPLPGHPEIVVDYKHLLNLEALGEESFIPEGLTERVNVKQLLDGVVSEQERRQQQEIRMREGKPEPRPTPPEPAEAEEAEAVAELAKVKAKLDLDAQNYARRCLWLYLGVLAAFWIVLGILTWRLGWSKMEPWTFFIVGGGGTLVSYLCFVITKGELTPKAIYNQIVESKKKKNYQAFGFDVEKYEKLMK
jgi:internalin A